MPEALPEGIAFLGAETLSDDGNGTTSESAGAAFAVVAAGFATVAGGWAGTGSATGAGGAGAAAGVAGAAGGVAAGGAAGAAVAGVAGAGVAGAGVAGAGVAGAGVAGAGVAGVGVAGVGVAAAGAGVAGTALFDGNGISEGGFTSADLLVGNTTCLGDVWRPSPPVGNVDEERAWGEELNPDAAGVGVAGPEDTGSGLAFSDDADESACLALYSLLA